MNARYIFLWITTLFIILTLLHPLYAQQAGTVDKIKLVRVGDGWANNSVNAVIFRKNSLVTWQDTQFVAFYNQESFVVLGKRKQGATQWTLQQTPYRGQAADAHNTISIAVDGVGYLHLSWDHHNNELRYCRSIKPGSLELTAKMPMTGKNEQRVTYPEFYRQQNGNLLFFYRNGESGQGNLVINQYNIKTQSWTQLQQNLIDGEGQRNAYWQSCVGPDGTIHLSWVWRESADVASNHDMGYACSRDGGITWEKSSGTKYRLPITAATTEYAARIPQNSELINQTSMSTDSKGNPYIATYWRDTRTNIPQYHLIYLNKGNWQVLPLPFRVTSFSLSGVGTKRIPISRPQVMVKKAGRKASVLMIYRDEERGSRVSAATINKISRPTWFIQDLTTFAVGSWEPTYDTDLWQKKKILNLFVQKVEQIDAEGHANNLPEPVHVLEWKPTF